jgi:NADPH-dependent ferric siderophore reductase
VVNLIHRANVVEVRPISPGMVRVVLGGDGLDGFVSSGVGDEYLRVFLPRDGQTEPVLPRPVGKDSWAFDEGVEPSPLRTYTVRDWNEASRELAIDMVVHERGLAGTWARTVSPGDVVGLNTPRGMYDAPAGLEWQLLVADAAGLPAAARILEQTPPGVRSRVVLEVPDTEHEVALELPERTELHWMHGGNGHGRSRLEEVVRSAEFPSGTGYVWVAGETRVTRGVRKYLRHELGWAASRYKVVGYWTENSEDWEERYESLPKHILERVEALWDDTDRDEEEIEDEYDSVLERFGL